MYLRRGGRLRAVFYKLKNRRKSSMAWRLQQYARRSISCAPRLENKAIPQRSGDVETLRAGIADVASIDRTADKRHAEFFRQIAAHRRYAVARDHDGHADLRGLDHHLAGHTPGREQHTSRAFDAMQAHPSADGVERIVAADVLDGHEQPAVLE